MSLVLMGSVSHNHRPNSSPISKLDKGVICFLTLLFSQPSAFVCLLSFLCFLSVLFQLFHFSSAFHLPPYLFPDSHSLTSINAHQPATTHPSFLLSFYGCAPKSLTFFSTYFFFSCHHHPIIFYSLTQTDEGLLT